MATKDFPLSLTIRAFDKATGPLRKVSAAIERATSPIRRLNNSFRALGAAAGLPKLVGGFQGVGSALGRVGSAAVGIGKTLGAMGAVAGFALFSMVKGSVEAGDKLSEMADRVGMSVDAYAQLQFVAGQADISQEEFNNSMDRFNANLGALKTGSGPFVELLKKVPEGFAKSVRGAKTTEEAFNLMVQGMEHIEDPATRARFAQELFGKSGMKMAGLLSLGTEEIRRQMRESGRLSGSQEKWARGAGALDNAMKQLEQAFGGVSIAVMGELFPALTELAGELKEFLVANREGIGKWAKETAAAITGWVKGGGIQRLMESFQKFSATVSPIVEKLGGWPVVLGGISAAILAGPILAALAALTTSFFTLGAAILTTPVGWFLLAVAAIAAAVWLIYDNWGGITKFFQDTFSGVQQLLNGFRDVVLGVLTLDFDRVVRGWTEATEGFRTSLVQALKLLAFLPGGNVALGALANSGALGALLGDSGAAAEEGVPQDMEARRRAVGEALSSRPKLDAAAARPQLFSSQPAQAQVSIDFRNAPPGTRMTSDSRNTADLSLSMGVSNLPGT